MAGPINSLMDIRPTQRTPSISLPTTIDLTKNRRNALDLHLNLRTSRSPFTSMSTSVTVKASTTTRDTPDAGTSSSSPKIIDVGDRDALSRYMAQRLYPSGGFVQVDDPSIFLLTTECSTLAYGSMAGHKGDDGVTDHLYSPDSLGRTINNNSSDSSLSDLSIPDLDYSRRGSIWSIATDTTEVQTPFDEDGDGSFDGKMAMGGRKEWGFPALRANGNEPEYRFPPLEGTQEINEVGNFVDAKNKTKGKANDMPPIATIEIPSATPAHMAMHIAQPTTSTTECNIIKPLSVTKPLRTRFVDELAEYFSSPAIASATTSLSACSAPRSRPRAALKIIGLLASTADQGSHLYADMTKKNCTSLTKDLRNALGNGHGIGTGANLAIGKNGDSHAEIGLLYEKRIVDGTFEAVKDEIERISMDGSVDGLIVYFPLFGIDKDTILRSLIPQYLDLEGLHPSHLSASYLSAPSRACRSTQEGSLLTSTMPDTPAPDAELAFPVIGRLHNIVRSVNEDGNVYPCTPLAIMRFLEHVLQDKVDQGLVEAYDGQWLRGKVCTVINRSEVVGRPLASFLANSGAIVYSIDHLSSHVYSPAQGAECEACNDKTDSALSESGLYKINLNGPTLEDALHKSDVVVSGVPVDSFKVPTKALKVGVVCLDFSTGDGNFEKDATNKASVLIPKIGPATILMLQQNAFLLRQRKQSIIA